MDKTFSNNKRHRSIKDNDSESPTESIQKYFRINKKEEKKDNPKRESLEQLSNKMSRLKNQVDELSEIVKKNTEDKNTLRIKLNELSNENIILKQKIDELEQKNHTLENEITKLKKERKEDTLKIKDLSEFIFIAKLRKLLKKMLEFIVNCDYLSKALKYENNKLYFIKVPQELTILGFDNSDIISALNKILEIIFAYSSNCDFRVHFVDKNAQKDYKYRHNLIVFNSYKEFFNYFKIEKYEDIITKIIPIHYLTCIDNYSFDVKIPELLGKI